MQVSSPHSPPPFIIFIDFSRVRFFGHGRSNRNRGKVKGSETQRIPPWVRLHPHPVGMPVCAHRQALPHILAGSGDASPLGGLEDSIQVPKWRWDDHRNPGGLPAAGVLISLLPAPARGIATLRAQFRLLCDPYIVGPRNAGVGPVGLSVLCGKLWGV